MILQSLSLTNFRSYVRLDVEFPQGITILSGGNAQGKTSLLESLFYCATFAPILAGNDRQLINFEAQKQDLAVARIVVRYSRDQQNHQLEVRIIQESQNRITRTRKEILWNGQKLRAQNAIGKFPAVLFIPQMTAILEGPPQERRRYLNILLSQSEPGYAQTLTEYKQALVQRNALLRQIADKKSDPAQLEYWDELLSSRGAVLIQKRIKALETLNEYAEEIHLQLTDRQEKLALIYNPSFDPLNPDRSNPVEENSVRRDGFSADEIASAMKAHLKTIRRREIERGTSVAGPHRDDFQVCANDIDLSLYGSRGQIRTALLSLKMAEIRWIQDKTGTEPLLLLDETLAELDEKRRRDLLERLDQYNQGILTTTDLTHFSDDFLKKHTVWQIANGVVKKD